MTTGTGGSDRSGCRLTCWRFWKPRFPKVREDLSLAQRVVAVGMTMIMSPPDVLRARMAAEVPRWKQLVPEIGIKTD